jgi:hypothetical protein
VIIGFSRRELGSLTWRDELTQDDAGTVDWSRLDFFSLDLYLAAQIRDRFTDIQGRYFACGRAVAITEFRSSTSGAP